MRSYQRILTLLLALCLTLSFAGCLVPKENEPADATGAPATDAAEPTAAVDTSTFDPEAIAVELGDIRITAGEISESYNYYMSMLESYYGSAPTDDASIKEYRDMAVEDLIHYRVPEWKAAQLGVTLDAQEEAKLEESVAAEIEEMRSSLICQYAYYYAGADEGIEDVSALTEEQIDVAMTQMQTELEEYFGEGYTLDKYLAEQHDSMVKDARGEALKEALRKVGVDDSALTDEQIDAWYETTLEKQKADFDETPLNFRAQRTDFLAGETNEPALYLPEGFVKVQLIEIAPEAERDLKIDENGAKMAELEKEYGKLALNGEDEARQAEILAEYAALKAENETLEEAFMGEARKKINQAYEALEEETPFEDVMKTFNENGPVEEYLYVAGDDAAYGTLCKIAAELLVGTYSEPVVFNNTQYIVKRVETPEAGALDRAAMAEEIRAAATESEKEAAWEALYEEWENEADQAAVRHEETYAAVGYMNATN